MPSVVWFAHSEHWVWLSFDPSLQHCVPLLYRVCLNKTDAHHTSKSNINHDHHYHQKFNNLHHVHPFSQLKKCPKRLPGHWGALGEPTAMGLSLPSLRGHPRVGATWGSGSCVKKNGGCWECTTCRHVRYTSLYYFDKNDVFYGYIWFSIYVLLNVDIDIFLLCLCAVYIGKIQYLLASCVFSHAQRCRDINM